MCTCMNYELQHKICTQHQQTIIDSIKHLVHKSKAILVTNYGIQYLLFLLKVKIYKSRK